jgi:hypothetical protein
MKNSPGGFVKLMGTGTMFLGLGAFGMSNLLKNIIGIAAGTIMTIIFIVDDNLKTQRLNEKLGAKSYEIKIQRSKTLTYLQCKRQQLWYSNHSRPCVLYTGELK